MIDSFTGQYAFLSNFFPSTIVYMGMAWPTVEHLYQGLKAGNEPATGILDCQTPGQAKKYGRKIQLRPDWEHVKDQVMLYCVRMKFLQPGFYEQLLATYPQELIEGNQWHDNYWGKCYCGRCLSLGVHRNMLGRILVQVRNELQSRSSHAFWLTTARTT